MVEKIERRKGVEIAVVFFDGIDTGYILFFFFQTHVTIMTEQIWVRDRVFSLCIQTLTLHDERIIAVREVELHLESQQQNVRDGMQSLASSS